MDRERSDACSRPCVETLRCNWASRLTSAVVVVATLMATLAAFGIPAEVLFSFGGLGGLAFGLAAKDFISNLIGGLAGSP